MISWMTLGSRYWLVGFVKFLNYVKSNIYIYIYMINRDLFNQNESSYSCNLFILWLFGLQVLQLIWNYEQINLPKLKLYSHFMIKSFLLFFESLMLSIRVIRMVYARREKRLVDSWNGMGDDSCWRNQIHFYGQQNL